MLSNVETTPPPSRLPETQANVSSLNAQSMRASRPTAQGRLGARRGRGGARSLSPGSARHRPGFANLDAGPPSIPSAERTLSRVPRNPKAPPTNERLSPAPRSTRAPLPFAQGETRGSSPPRHRSRPRAPPARPPAPPAPRPHLQPQGRPAASQELADVAQALALAPGLRVDLQHRAQALNAARRPGAPRGEPAAAPRGRARPSRNQAGQPWRPGATLAAPRRPRARPPPLLTLFPSSRLHQSPQAPSLTRKWSGGGSDVFRPRPGQPPSRDPFRPPPRWRGLLALAWPSASDAAHRTRATRALLRPRKLALFPDAAPRTQPARPAGTRDSLASAASSNNEGAGENLFFFQFFPAPGSRGEGG